MLAHSARETSERKKVTDFCNIHRYFILLLSMHSFYIHGVTVSQMMGSSSSPSFSFIFSNFFLRLDRLVHKKANTSLFDCLLTLIILFQCFRKLSWLLECLACSVRTLNSPGTNLALNLFVYQNANNMLGNTVDPSNFAMVTLWAFFSEQYPYL